MKSQTIVCLGINLDIIEFIGEVSVGGVLAKVPLVHLGGKKLTRPRVSKEYKEWVTKQYEVDLDSTLVNMDFVYKELDEKMMLGLRLKEGLDVYEVFKEQNWKTKKFEYNFCKLLKEWERFLESGLLIRKGNRFFLSEPKGMDLSNQILISMFKWWDEIN